MNLHHVQQTEEFKNASKDCRSEFIESMRGRQYGASETLDAWVWFYAGWMAAIKIHCM